MGEKPSRFYLIEPRIEPKKTVLYEQAAEKQRWKPEATLN